MLAHQENLAERQAVDDPVQQALRSITNLAVETAGGVHFTTSYHEDSGYLVPPLVSPHTFLLIPVKVLNSDARTEALLLSALVDVDPDNELVIKLLATLQARQKKGRWNNTQEAATPSTIVLWHNVTLTTSPF